MKKIIMSNEEYAIQALVVLLSCLLFVTNLWILQRFYLGFSRVEIYYRSPMISSPFQEVSIYRNEGANGQWTTQYAYSFFNTILEFAPRMERVYFPTFLSFVLFYGILLLGRLSNNKRPYLYWSASF